MAAAQDKIAALKEALGVRPASETPRLGGEAEAKRKKDALMTEMRGRALNRVQSGEEAFLDLSHMEDQLGGKIVEDEIPSLWFQNRLGSREELDRAVQYTQESGYLPEGAKAFGAKKRDGGFTVVYQKPDEEGVFRTVNRPGPSYGDIGRYAPDPTSLEFWGEVGAELSFGKGLGRLGRYAIQALAAATGRATDEIIEDVSVGGDIDPERVLARAAESGLFSPVGRAVGETGEAAANLARGRGFKLGVSDPKEADQAVQAGVRAAQEEGFPTLSAGELNNPILRRAETISEAVSPKQHERRMERLSAPARTLYLEGQGAESLPEIGDEALETIIRREEQSMRDEFGRAIKRQGLDFKRTTKERGGRALGESITDYAELSSERGRRLYDEVFNIAEAEGVQFDISRTKQLADELGERIELEGTKAPEAKMSGLVDASGRPIPASEQPGPRGAPLPSNIPKQYGEQLNAVIEGIQEAADLQGGDRLRALRNLRTYLRDLSEPSTGLKRNPTQGAAARLLRQLNQDIRESSEAGSAALQGAARAADRFWGGRSRILEGFRFADQLDDVGGGERIYRQFMSNPTEEAANLAMNLMGRERRDEFRSAMITDLMENPAQISQTIRSLGGAAEKVLPESARGVLRRFEREWKRMDKNVFRRMLEEEAEGAQRFRQIVDAGDTKAIQRLISQRSMPEDTVRERIFYNFFDDTTDFVEGRHVLNPNKYESAFKKYKESGMLDFLNPRQKKMLDNIRTYGSFIRHATDAGSSIAGAEVASSQLYGLSNPGAALKGRFKMLQLATAARLANSPKLVRALSGMETPQEYPVVRATLLGMTNLAHQAGLRSNNPQPDSKGKPKPPEVDGQR